MTQRDRDRLVALKKAKKKLITQRQAAEEIGVTERLSGTKATIALRDIYGSAGHVFMCK